MGINLFGWLRRLAKESVIQGVGDAVRELAPAEGDSPDLEALRSLLATPPKALEGRRESKGKEK